MAATPERGRNERLNQAAFQIGRYVGGRWLDRAEMEGDLLLAAEACGLPAGEARKTIKSGLDAGERQPLPEPGTEAPAPSERPTTPDAPEAPVCLPSGAPLDAARAFLEARHTDAQRRHTLRRWRGSWWVYDGAAYREKRDEKIREGLYRYFDGVWVAGKNGPVKFNPTKAKLANVVDAMVATGTLVDDEAEPPVWVGDGGEDLSSHAIVPVGNGLLDLASGRLSPLSPNLFITSAIPVAWDTAAPEPVEWLRLLDSLWGDDTESIELLQEWFGYCLTSDTSQQKMLMMVGPKRSGKGTIVATLRALLGELQCTASTLAGLTRNFGLQSFLSKLLAVFPDVRLSGRTDIAEVAELLLMLTGEDAVLIDRKHKAPVTVLLPTRLVLLSNEVPKLEDASGALRSRFMMLQFTASFFGREDHGLRDRLQGELPGILRWAVEGWRRLQRRGRFSQPKAGKGLEQELKELGSPVEAFVEEMCDVGPECREVCSYVYKAYQLWARAQGVLRVPPANLFGRDLRAAVEGLKTDKAARGVRQKLFVGLKLNTEAWMHLRDKAPSPSHQL